MTDEQLIKAIYDRCADMRDGIHLTTDQYVDRCQDIIDMIELHRPEIAGKLPTHESKMEEMRKYPLQDNHMD